MENASKALLMAAGILISILIISLAVYLFITFGALSSDIHKKNQETQLTQFNEQFTSYANISQGVNIYDIITMANLAKENNANYELTSADAGENSYYIRVDFLNIYNFENKDQSEYNEQIKQHSSYSNYNASLDKLQQKTYNCKVDISSKTGRVYKVTITEK